MSSSRPTMFATVPECRTTFRSIAMELRTPSHLCAGCGSASLHVQHWPGARTHASWLILAMQPGACAVAPAPRAVERPGGRSEASKVKALSLSARALALAYRSFRFGARGVPWPFGIELQTQLHHCWCSMMPPGTSHGNSSGMSKTSEKNARAAEHCIQCKGFSQAKSDPAGARSFWKGLRCAGG